MAYRGDLPNFRDALTADQKAFEKAQFSCTPQYPPPASGLGCANSLKDVEPGLSTEADQIASLSGTLVSLVETVRGYLDPNFVPSPQNSTAPPAAHLRYQLSNAIGNTNHTIEQLRLILDIVSR